MSTNTAADDRPYYRALWDVQKAAEILKTGGVINVQHLRATVESLNAYLAELER